MEDSTPAGTVGVTPVESWGRALDALEAQILIGRQLAEGRSPAVLAPWSEPTDLGPFPAELLDRARELREQQQGLLADLPEFIGRIRKQLSLTRKVSGATSAARRPVYIDHSA
ncbi:hypothetical protein [Nocardioides sp.]|jgi:hypothetical protein|uniref:hypothetical protein n=1 Tax=Nocardioides sp. TaxID=35761 RepID=UPI002B6558BA|nr:hypothetical protein [Nocardioides sp.]HVX54722.1 hypothetical protein [Nocardioides sp.]